MNKEQTLSQCAEMVAACWNYYATNPLTINQKLEIKRAIEKIVTQSFEENDGYKAIVEENERARRLNPED